MKVAAPPSQSVTDDGWPVITVVGFTVMVKVTGVPVQVVPPLVKLGVTVIVAVTGAVPVLVAVNEAILPVPLAARPIEVVLFVQLYTVPGTKPVKLTAVVAAPLHTTWLATALTVGDGLTVMVKVLAVPVQVVPPLVKVGVTVMVAVTAALVLLVARNGAILPVPLAPRPIVVLLFVQLYTVPATLPVKLTAAVLLLLHTTWLATALTVGVGLTVIVKVTGVPVQVLPLLKLGVTVMVAVTAALVALVATNDAILPVPLAASPIDGVLLVQLYTIVPPVVGLVNVTDAVEVL